RQQLIGADTAGGKAAGDIFHSTVEAAPGAADIDRLQLEIVAVDDLAALDDATGMDGRYEHGRLGHGGDRPAAAGRAADFVALPVEDTLSAAYGGQLQLRAAGLQAVSIPEQSGVMADAGTPPALTVRFPAQFLLQMLLHSLVNLLLRSRRGRQRGRHACKRDSGEQAEGGKNASASVAAPGQRRKQAAQ